MKSYFRILIAMICCLPVHNASGQLNQYDDSGRKTGKWKISATKESFPEYPAEATVSEGNYVNSRKDGLWIMYWPGGNIKQKITYKYGRSHGLFEVYYESGQLKESGTMVNGKYHGTHLYYYPSGCLQTKQIFDQEGKLIENQYFEDCMEVFVPPAEKGKMTTTTYQESTPKERPKTYTGVKDGYHKVYAESKDLLMEGEFMEGSLYNGKYYVYDNLGLFKHIEVYKEGSFSHLQMK